MNIEDIKDEILSECRHSLPERAVPEDVIIMESLPLTSVGKINYRALEGE